MTLANYNFMNYFKDMYKSVSSMDWSGENIFNIPAECKYVKVVYDYGRIVEVVDKTDVEVNDGYVVINVYDMNNFKKVLIPVQNIDYVEWIYE